MVTALYVFAIIGAFLIGGLVTWTAKDYVDAYIDNAAYAKSIVHPEMLDEDGNVDQSELLYLRFTDNDDTLDAEDDD
jgi:hypothetical protein|tara:strand:+ start:5443 stop:5673 length:231 start_codon:yes stop_codon:yes gene_type:complete